MISACRNQIRTTGFGVYAADFPAFLTFADAAGLPSDWLTDLLPGIEAALIDYHSQESEDDGQED
ncbi:MAG: hypothetical protein NVV72_01045 [Asticcacaulis sp.]|nr:hypothetical protein [Asticcacaulis sp.]